MPFSLPFAPGCNRGFSTGSPVTIIVLIYFVRHAEMECMRPCKFYSPMDHVTSMKSTVVASVPFITRRSIIALTSHRSCWATVQVLVTSMWRHMAAILVEFSMKISVGFPVSYQPTWRPSFCFFLFALYVPHLRPKFKLSVIIFSCLKKTLNFFLQSKACLFLVLLLTLGYV